MNILKPQKIVYEELKIIENFQEEIKEKDEFENIIIQNYKEQNINIYPVYNYQNLLNIEFSGIFEIKMIHIINIIYILNKKEGVKKNERTSNRRSYDYSYE